MSFHVNNGNCNGCRSILNRYADFHHDLRSWFEQFQFNHPEAHISCAGRGQADQEALLLRKASKANWKESAHNYNAALDIFEQSGDKTNIYEASWYHNVLYPELPHWLDWYGKPDAKFRELPHVEIKDWEKLRDSGQLKLVE